MATDKSLLQNFIQAYVQLSPRYGDGSKLTRMEAKRVLKVVDAT